MPTYTTNYGLAKPLVNSAVDQDLWGGELNTNMDTIDTTLKSISDAAAASRLPIGSIYMNYSDGTNPATLLGYGTWTAITDKFVVARGSTYTSTGGAATVTLTINELPPHTHGYSYSDMRNSGNLVGSSGGANFGNTTSATTNSTGSGSAFSIIPPYQAVYMWYRST